MDFLRGIAILMVFFYHSLCVGFGYHELPWNSWLRSFDVPRSFLLVLPLALGWAGVAIFFSLSGFCIHLSFARSRSQSFKEFYIRRFYRIFPPYLLALIFFTLIIPKNRESFPSFEFWWQGLSHLLLIHNFDRATLFGIDPSFWSLAVEAQLYLIYPALIFLVRRLGWKRSLLVLATVEITIRATIGIHFFNTGGQLPQWVTGSPLTYWFSWALGAAVAEAFLQQKPFFLARFPSWVWLLLACGAWFVKPLTSFSFMLFAVWTASMVTKAISGSAGTSTWKEWVPLPGFIREHIRLAGVLSYSLYLWHQPFLGMIEMTLRRHLPPAFNLDIVRFAACSTFWVVLIPMAMLLYRYCELPAIEAGKAWLKQSKSRQASRELESSGV